MGFSVRGNLKALVNSDLTSTPEVISPDLMATHSITKEKDHSSNLIDECLDGVLGVPNRALNLALQP